MFISIVVKTLSKIPKLTPMVRLETRTYRSWEGKKIGRKNRELNRPDWQIDIS